VVLSGGYVCLSLDDDAMRAISFRASAQQEDAGGSVRKRSVAVHDGFCPAGLAFIYPVFQPV
jgi:hypothetical protein